jgi:riboflavin kinase/FMN adenylyltransferase
MSPSPMQLIRRSGRNPARLPGPSVVTIGTFDGVHIGHQRILTRVIEEARARSLPSVVFSFEPTPGEFFSAGSPPARLTRFREKYEALDGFGLDWLCCPPFDANMEKLGPDEFIERMLVKQLAVQHLVVGDDFRFAKSRAGTIGHLRSGGERFGFTVEQVPSVVAEGGRISSTGIRDLLAAGELERAKRLLGRYYRMTGRVIGGMRLGKQLGYPTANVSLNRRASPLGGIFAVRVDGLGGPSGENPSGGKQLLDGVASLGTRPTVDGTELVLEVHIFDFDRSIYGEYIQVEFIEKLRDEAKFPDLDSMTEQIHIDAAQARAILSRQ